MHDVKKKAIVPSNQLLNSFQLMRLTNQSDNCGIIHGRHWEIESTSESTKSRDHKPKISTGSGRKMKQNTSNRIESSLEDDKLECTQRPAVTQFQAIIHNSPLLAETLTFKKRLDIQIFNQIIHILPCYVQTYFGSFIKKFLKSVYIAFFFYLSQFL